jgi:hypothetical protein
MGKWSDKVDDIEWHLADKSDEKNASIIFNK